MYGSEGWVLALILFGPAVVLVGGIGFVVGGILSRHMAYILGGGLASLLAAGFYLFSVGVRF